MYNIIYETSRQSRFDARYRMLGAGALGRPRGLVWGGRREEGSGWRTRVYRWWIHVDIWQNQYNIVKLKKKNNTGVGCHFLLQGIFLTQGLNPGLLHCRQILFHLSHQGSTTKRLILTMIGKKMLQERLSVKPQYMREWKGQYPPDAQSNFQLT